MTAINMSHYKLKLQTISKQLYLDHDWHMPPGLQCQRNSNPLNYTLAEWQQANRRGNDPKEMKAVLQACWKQSDSKKAFAHALEENGYTLARGTRRGYVAIDFKGEVYSLSRWLDVKTKDLKAKLGDAESLPSVIEAQVSLAKRMLSKIDGFVREIQDHKKKEAASLIQAKTEMLQRHREERTVLKYTQDTRWQEETIQRSKRLPRGIKAVWYFVTGKYQHIRKQNELETKQCLTRDREQMQVVIDRQLKERRTLKQQVNSIREKQRGTLNAFRSDINHYAALKQATQYAPVLELKTDDAENQKDKSRKGEGKGDKSGAGAGGSFDRRSRPRGYMDSSLMPIWRKAQVVVTDRKPEAKQAQQQKEVSPVQASRNTERRIRRGFVMANRRG